MYNRDLVELGLSGLAGNPGSTRTVTPVSDIMSFTYNRTPIVFSQWGDFHKARYTESLKNLDFVLSQRQLTKAKTVGYMLAHAAVWAGNAPDNKGALTVPYFSMLMVHLEPYVDGLDILLLKAFVSAGGSFFEASSAPVKADFASTYNFIHKLMAA